MISFSKLSMCLLCQEGQALKPQGKLCTQLDNFPCVKVVNACARLCHVFILAGSLGEFYFLPDQVFIILSQIATT